MRSHEKIPEVNELLKLDDEALLNTSEVAALTGLQAETLSWYRCVRPERGPAFRRIAPRMVRYRMGDVRAYLSAREG
jgi:predicted DNA-binding transcriptional regulator AlpA